MSSFCLISDFFIYFFTLNAEIETTAMLKAHAWSPQCLLQCYYHKIIFHNISFNFGTFITYGTLYYICYTPPPHFSVILVFNYEMISSDILDGWFILFFYDIILLSIFFHKLMQTKESHMNKWHAILLLMFKIQKTDSLTSIKYQILNVDNNTSIIQL